MQHEMEELEVFAYEEENKLHNRGQYLLDWLELNDKDIEDFTEEDQQEYENLFQSVRKKTINYVIDEHISCMVSIGEFTELDLAVQLLKHEAGPSEVTTTKLRNATMAAIWSLEAVKKSVELCWLKFDGDMSCFIRQRVESELWVKKRLPGGAGENEFEMQRVRDDNFKTFSILSRADVLQKLENVHYFAALTRWKQFGPEWLRHPKIRTCSLLECDPTLSVCDDRVFNIWQGFAVEALWKVRQDEVAALVKPIVDHLEMLLDHDCGEGCVKSSRYLLAWLSQQVRCPGERSKVAIILRGKQARTLVHSRQPEC